MSDPALLASWWQKNPRWLNAVIVVLGVVVVAAVGEQLPKGTPALEVAWTNLSDRSVAYGRLRNVGKDPLVGLSLDASTAPFWQIGDHQVRTTGACFPQWGDDPSFGTARAWPASSRVLRPGEEVPFFLLLDHVLQLEFPVTVVIKAGPDPSAARRIRYLQRYGNLSAESHY